MSGESRPVVRTDATYGTEVEVFGLLPDETVDWDGIPGGPPEGDAKD